MHTDSTHIQPYMYVATYNYSYTSIKYIATRSAKINHVSAQNHHIFSNLQCHNSRFSYGVRNKMNFTPHAFMENLLKLTE